MATVIKKSTIQYNLCLDTIEAEFLRSFLQNPPDTEEPRVGTIRENIFIGLNSTLNS